MKKILLLGILMGIFLLACQQISQNNTTQNQKQNTSVPNPASEFCVKQGGELKIIETDEGQKGVCYINGVMCDEWAFFRGECPKKESPTDEITLTYQPMQCVQDPWDKWYSEGNIKFVKAPTKKEIVLAYYGTMGINVLDFKEIESGRMVCEACEICPETYYYEAIVKGNYDKMLEEGWKR